MRLAPAVGGAADQRAAGSAWQVGKGTEGGGRGGVPSVCESAMVPPPMSAGQRQVRPHVDATSTRAEVAVAAITAHPGGWPQACNDAGGGGRRRRRRRRCGAELSQ
eukprot:TRINITY_DN12908_c0_g1_i1.p5 TRINITY_DN12908_c0_g1~~TRINITY_DN12908_c0_g1_i1.p5  ORF type:complete len:106 (+),score=18.21 TRINITY_DN12908_c0_g1_i1:526-843(+)